MTNPPIPPAVVPRDAPDPHPTRPVKVWADIDVGIADWVEYLNSIPGVRTDASCQGTIGEGGPHPHGPYIMAHWGPDAEARLRLEFDVAVEGECWGYLHPRAGVSAPSTNPPAVVEAMARAIQAKANEFDILYDDEIEDDELAQVAQAALSAALATGSVVICSPELKALMEAAEEFKAADYDKTMERYERVGDALHRTARAFAARAHQEEK